jgi:hypothetical protein
VGVGLGSKEPVTSLVGAGVPLGVGSGLPESGGTAGDVLGEVAGERVVAGFGLVKAPGEGAPLGVAGAAGGEPEGAGVDDGSGRGATPRIAMISAS